MNDFELFQQLRKKHHLTHEATAKLLRASASSINSWVTNKDLPKWPVLLLKRKLALDFELPKIKKSKELYLKTFCEAHALSLQQVADIIGVNKPRLKQWLYGVSPCPLWAVESLILGVLFDRDVSETIAKINFAQIRKEISK